MASLEEQKVMSGNQDMPENVYGMRFNPLSGGVTDWTFSFFSNRLPVWGDFYARCGGFQGGINKAYNYNMDGLNVERGFISPDVDPVAGPSDGSVDFHILRPDSVVPEPATAVLLVLGSLLVLRKRK